MSKLTRNEGFPAAEATEDAAVVRAMYQALEEQNVPAFACHADAAIEWIHPMATRLPFDGTQRGFTAVLRNAFRRDVGGAGPRICAETFLEFGDGVLVAGRFLSPCGAQDGTNEEPFLHECFVRGDKVIRIREYPAQATK